MSHKKASTDPGKDLHLYSRIGMYNEQVISVFNADGTDYDFSNVGIEIGVKRNRGDEDFVTLTEGNGVTITDNDINFVFTENQSSLFTQRTYYWQLRRIIDGHEKVWLNGDHDWHNGKFDSFSNISENITVTDYGDILQITINDSSGGGLSTVVTDDVSIEGDGSEGNPIKIKDGYLNTRVQSTTTTATLTPDIDNYDLFEITEQAEALSISAPTGTPINGNAFVIRITDNGTDRTISFNSIYRVFGSSLPTTTTANKTLYIAVVYNSTDNKYDVLNSIEEV